MAVLNNNTIQKILNLRPYLLPRRSFQIAGILALSLIVSFLEIISIGLVLPFLSVLTEPELIFNNHIVLNVREYLHITTHNQLLLYITVVFVFALIVSSLIKIIHLWVLARVSNAIGSDLSYTVYKNVINTNSSEIINAVLTKVDRTVLQIIIPFLYIISSLIVVVIILVAIISLSPKLAISVICAMGFIYSLIILLTRKQLLVNSDYIAHSSDKLVQLIQESRGSIKDIILGGFFTAYGVHFRNLDWKYRYKQGVNLTINQGPRFGVEALGISFIVILAYILTTSAENPQFVLPTLGVLVFAMQKMLPLFQLIYRSWSMIQGGMGSFEDVTFIIKEGYDKENLKKIGKHLFFKNDVTLNNISFRYGNSGKYIFKNVNIKMTKGTCVGVLGDSGSGKTTFIDLIMGLIQPSEGELLIDGTKVSSHNVALWHKHISHVPQEVFLADASIAENIALGIPKDKINPIKLRECINKAQLSDLIYGLNQKENTVVGEMGSLLSGGQRQRIAIARALYAEADVLIFDEATNALDEKTENEVVSVLKNIKDEILLIIISHRPNTLKMCDKTIDINQLK